MEKRTKAQTFENEGRSPNLTRLEERKLLKRMKLNSGDSMGIEKIRRAFR